jgi:hypothetical protein
MRTIERQLQQNLYKIQKWAIENGFKFSKSKTQYVASVLKNITNKAMIDNAGNQLGLQQVLLHMGSK